MYNRPGNLFKDFFIEKQSGEVSDNGRPIPSYGRKKAMHIKAILAMATPKEVERFSQPGHPVTHTICHRGELKAGIKDLLICGNRVFEVQGRDDPGGLGRWAMYYAEERSDLSGD